MDVLKIYEDYHSQIIELEEQLNDIKHKRVLWSRENSKEIKKLFQKKGTIYEVIDIHSIDEYDKADFIDKVGVDDPLYFKVTNTRFDPEKQFHWSNAKYPKVAGEFLDVNLKKIRDRWRDDTVYITNLKDVDEKRFLGNKNRITKVYVMIDKNTGYYKIGRSKNPKFRERTLQSEKPTIELLFHYDTRVRVEKELHDMFAEKRIRGEWFDLNGSDLNTVKEYLNT